MTLGAPRRWIVAGSGSAALVLAAILSVAAPIVRLRVAPAVARAPADWTVLVWVAPHAENRTLWLLWAHECGPVGRSGRLLAGGDALAQQWFYPHVTEAGRYTVEAQVISATGRLRGRASTTAVVTGAAPCGGGA